jgi:phage-related protein
MPLTQVVFFAELGGRAPVLEWLKELRRWDPEAFAKCRAAIELLRVFGYELRRPAADFLRDGIHELRVRRGRVHYRILYFFHGRSVAVLVHGLTKEGAVPDRDIERALRRKRELAACPERHVHQE